MVVGLKYVFFDLFKLNSKFESSCNVLDQDEAFRTTCSKNMLIYLKVSVKWLVTRTCWNLETVGFPFVQVKLQVEQVEIIL